MVSGYCALRGKLFKAQPGTSEGGIPRLTEILDKESSLADKIDELGKVEERKAVGTIQIFHVLDQRRDLLGVRAVIVKEPVLQVDPTIRVITFFA